MCQGTVFGAVSSGPYDDVEENYEGRGMLQAVESADLILPEILLGKDPTQQTKIDKLLAQEESLPANVVSAASIACCKAGAKQNLAAVFNHVCALCNNSEGGIPATAFSTINGGQGAASSLWVQVSKQARGAEHPNTRLSDQTGCINNRYLMHHPRTVTSNSSSHMHVLRGYGTSRLLRDSIDCLAQLS